ncbi:MAG: lipid-A-disaccharide synthase N-terminal domain-containing protein [Thermoanaerobaculia bacterium]|nr:lipid-A-disaccharide synthase N-terminal domain-containing protein [Thermoanaerobaculia bacterium]
MSSETIWIVVGFAGQALFAARFLVQWIASERKQRSVIPLPFWFLSLGGGLVLLTYAIHRRDPVFIAGQSTGVYIYLRNLWLIYRERAEETPPD